jgi:hypothetical protein
MKIILVAILSGAVGAALTSFLFQPTFANEVEQRAREVLGVPACWVRTGVPRWAVGTRCDQNEVVVGFRSDSVSCAHIYVSCN